MWAHVQLDGMSCPGWQSQQPALVLVLVRGPLIDLVCQLLQAAAACAAGCAASVAAGLVRAWWLVLLRCRMLLKRCAAALCLVQSKLLPLEHGWVYTMLFMLHYLCSTAAAGALPLTQARQLRRLLRFAWQELIEPVVAMCMHVFCRLWGRGL